MFIFNSREDMISRAARRVSVSYLEKQRTYSLYKRHVKDAKDTKELENDETFKSIRDAMQTAKLNYEGAKLSFDAVKAIPPLC